MRIGHVFTILLLMAAQWGKGQSHRVYLTEREQDDKIKKSLAIIPVYQYESDSIEPYTHFGIAKKPEERDLVIRRLPDMSQCRDTGYSFIYFSGADNEINQGYCLAMIGNFKRSLRPVYFFIDKNNNLDFTDDGPPDSITYHQSNTTIKFTNPDNKDAHHFVKLTRIAYGKNLKYKKLLTEHYQKHSGRKKFININYCYREQRLNTLSGVFVNEADSFKIALKDMNSDGLFNETCRDRFYVGAADELISTDIMTRIPPEMKNVYFEWNKKRYRITNIEPTGAYLDFEEVKDAVLEKALKVGKKVPNFSYVTISNEKQELKAFKKKEVFIFFWDKETLTSEDTLYLGKLHREFSNQLEIITLNHGDVPRTVRIMHFYDRIEWPIGFSSTGIGRMFYVESLTKGVYLKKRRKLKDDDISPKEVYESMRTKTK
jgi:hypothetical protein